MLRLDDQRYRTCLDCLGQGQVLQARGVTTDAITAAITTAEMLQGRSSVSISVSASSVAR